jgi:DNA-binding beta-propeller fold protein YncE
MSQSHEKTHQHSCPACNYGPFLRNNYFTGKLLVERDFTDESLFHIDKLRHHEQQLHGWGVVCGFRVKPHPNESCRDRFVCIEPGTAVDCCGHDIIVREQECIEITELPEVKALQGLNDQKPHKLQICVRFRECPTEDIPILYDDCGCDDTKCAPNRILESHKFGVIVDGKDALEPYHTPKLKRKHTVDIAHATRVALHDASHSLYVVTADSPSTFYKVSTDTHAIVTSRALPAKAIALKVSSDGQRVYVISEPVAPATLRRLLVLDATAVALPDFNTSLIELAGSAGSDVKLEVAPDSRLLAYVATTGDVLRWATDIDTNPTPAAAVKLRTIPANLTGPTISTDGKTAYFTGPANKIQSLDLTSDTPAAPTITTTNLANTAKLSAMVLVSSAGKDLLAVANDTDSSVSLFDSAALTTSLGTAQLDHPPIGLAPSPAGHWVYVLEKDAGGSFIQAVSIAGIQKTPIEPPSAPFKVGPDSQQIIISKSASYIYVPFIEDLTNAALGGVAIVEVSEESCSDILWRHLEGCPHCDTPDCVVLATIENYNFGDKILALTDPPDPTNDAANKIARINNRLGRRLLPSTQVMTELIECLLEHGTEGTQGPTGPQGPKGDTVVGPAGPAGPGLEEGLVRIEALSWSHNALHKGGTPPAPDSFFVMVERRHAQPTPGIVIGFTDIVRVSTTVGGQPVPLIDADHIFRVLVQTADAHDPAVERGIICRCPIRGKTVPVKLNLDAQNRIVVNAAGRIDEAAEVPPGDARGVAFLLDPEIAPIARNIVNGSVPEVSVILRGDFVIEATPEGRAIDAEFVRAELPTGDRPRPPAGQDLKKQLGIQGGTFESWFTVKRQG